MNLCANILNSDLFGAPSRRLNHLGQEIPYTYYTDEGSKIFGALKYSIDSLQKQTTYVYDENNGQLLITGYHDNSAIMYTYDEAGRLVNASPGRYCESSNLNTNYQSSDVDYVYNSAGILEKIITDSTEYTISYNKYLAESGISIGDRTLATYEYNTRNGKLNKINYGNGFSEEYVYNTLEMLSEVWYTYDDGTREQAFAYTYNHDGTLDVVSNILEGKATKYEYDNYGRLVGIHEKDTDEELYSAICFIHYDTDDKVSAITPVITYSSTTSAVSRLLTNSYNYNTHGALSSETLEYLSANHKITYEYDNLNRISEVVKDFGGFDYSTAYSYLNGFENGRENDNTSYLVERDTSTIGSSSTTYNYDYDYRGNITIVEKGGVETIYTYDDLGQLTRESDGETSRVYTYDNAGNIISIKSEQISSDSGMIIRANLPSLAVDETEKTLTYTDSEWGDLLTSFNGTTITYDEIGNPLSYYNGTAYTFTWEGRKLVRAVKGSKNLTFDYNDEGIRTSKTVNGVKHTYQLNGSQIIAEEWGNKLLVYIYDASGSPIGMMYRTTSYDFEEWDVFWFEKNLQGDIVAVYDEDGTKVATYKYSDAWGNHSVSYSNDGASTGAKYNPFRYRGYYYDSDLGMYYLQSRYYDANICRFINADSALYHSSLGYNLFVYCENAPVGKIDITGQYCVDIMDDDGNPFNDWLLECASGGGAKAGYYGPGTSYYNYQVRTGTAAYDALLGGYHSTGLSSAMVNLNYYCVFGAVSVTDSMATDSLKTSRVRNPWGKKGGPHHQSTIQLVKDIYEDMGYEVNKEVRIDTIGGKKPIDMRICR